MPPQAAWLTLRHPHTGVCWQPANVLSLYSAAAQPL